MNVPRGSYRVRYVGRLKRTSLQGACLHVLGTSRKGHLFPVQNMFFSLFSFYFLPFSFFPTLQLLIKPHLLNRERESGSG